jgi:diadenosine tetraphosphatase ApaH/serine/threonine PP2A family protein phosphatase
VSAASTSSGGEIRVISTASELLRVTDIGTFTRVALLADVHGNAHALAAVLDDLAGSDVEAVCALGCLTWGPEPQAVLGMIDELGLPSFFLCGNGERAVLELADGTREPEQAVDEWMVAAHGTDALRRLAAFPPALRVSITGGERARLCHGSPRSDIELLTPGTDPTRVAEACGAVDEPIVVHGHTHLQYQRVLGSRTIAGCGSVGLPYTEDGPGAYWTVLDADGVHPRRTDYDVDRAVSAIEAMGYPATRRYVGVLRTPPTPAEIVADAEAKVFSD